MLLVLIGGLLLAGGSLFPSAEEETKPEGRTVHIRTARDGPHIPLTGFMRTEDGTLCYYSGPDIPYTGWMETEEGFRYFTEDGSEARGFREIGGDLYYFDNGLVTFGWKTIEGKYYLFDKTTGKAVLGWLPSEGHLIYISAEDGIIGSQSRVIDGILCSFDSHGWLTEGGPAGTVPGQDGRFLDEDGRIRTGYFEKNGDWYFTDENGYIRTGFQEIDGVRYHFQHDGKASAAWVREDGKTYYADFGGKLNRGFREIDGALYYFDPDDYTLVTDTVINDYIIDAAGVCRNRFGEITEANLEEYVGYLLERFGSSPREIYDYVVKNYTFRFKEKTDVRSMAIRMFNTGYGACWDFAAVTQLLLEAAGYRTLWVVGESGLRESHDWLLVEMEEGVWRHMDTMRRQYLIYNLTDEELAAYDGVAGSYVWDRAKWTSTTPTGTGGEP